MHTAATPPAHVAPAVPPQADPTAATPSDPTAVMLREIVVEVGGQRFPIKAGVLCHTSVAKTAHLIVSVPSRIATLAISCDDAAEGIETIDDEPMPAPVTRSAAKGFPSQR